MKQVTIHYKNNPKDYRVFLKDIMYHVPILGKLGIMVYVLNYLAILLAIYAILPQVLVFKLPFKTVIDDNKTFLMFIIWGTVFLHIFMYISKCLIYKKFWGNFQKIDSAKIKSITFRENDMSVQKISEDKDIEYSSFTKIRIKRRGILFLKGKKIAIICPKKYFTEEEWDTVKKWLK